MYVGRFAPSPTGDLHLGTLTAAVASFLHARRAQAEWLVRIEDIDPPREVPGAADAILRTLESLALEWDRTVLYQSTRIEAHLAAAERLLESGDAFRCSCSRQQILAATGATRYPGTCRLRRRHDDATAVRLRVDAGRVRFTDRLRGPVVHDIVAAEGDFVIVRRDGLPAYHLAVVLDDAYQGVTDIVRGGDLLDSTPLHIHLQQRLSLPTPHYWHIPIITNPAGEKLSKSKGDAAIETLAPSDAARRVLTLLGATPPEELAGADPSTYWAWACRHWQLESLAAAPRAVAVDT